MNIIIDSYTADFGCLLNERGGKLEIDHRRDSSSSGDYDTACERDLIRDILGGSHLAEADTLFVVAVRKREHSSVGVADPDQWVYPQAFVALWFADHLCGIQSPAALKAFVKRPGCYLYTLCAAKTFVGQDVTTPVEWSELCRLVFEAERKWAAESETADAK